MNIAYNMKRSITKIKICLTNISSMIELLLRRPDIVGMRSVILIINE